MRTNCIVLMAALLFLVLTADFSWALSPPWWTTQRLYANSFGASTCVTVEPIHNDNKRKMTLDISACEDEVAGALATILRRRWTFGKKKLFVRVYGPSNQLARPNRLSGASIENLAAMIGKALQGNPYLVEIHILQNPLTHRDVVVVECAKKVIQFWNDNLGDLYGNENYVAADVFQQVTRPVFPGSKMFAGYSTAIEE